MVSRQERRRMQKGWICVIICICGLLQKITGNVIISIISSSSSFCVSSSDKATKQCSGTKWTIQQLNSLQFYIKRKRACWRTQTALLQERKNFRLIGLKTEIQGTARLKPRLSNKNNSEWSWWVSLNYWWNITTVAGQRLRHKVNATSRPGSSAFGWAGQGRESRTPPHQSEARAETTAPIRKRRWHTQININ